MSHPAPDPPFMSLVPVRHHRWEETGDDRITVLVPKFTSRLARRWLVPLLARPDVRLRLDDVGSFVWRACDGRTTVADLAARVRDRFGGEAEDARARVTTFLRQLARTSSVTFLAPVGPAGAAADSP